MAAERQGGLTLKQVLFAEAYIGSACGNGTEAARMAGYEGDAATLAVVACNNLKLPEIAERVAERVREAVMSADECLRLLAEIARRDDREFVQFRTDARGNVVEAKINLADKIRALELIGKHLNLFTEKIEVEHVRKALIGVDLDRI